MNRGTHGFTAPGKNSACPATATVPAGSSYYGCIVPYAASSPSSAFGTKTGTNTTLYGPRQIQVSAKLFF